MKIAVIGCGNMGGALVRGWCASGIAEDITITAKTQDTLDSYQTLYPELNVTLSNADAVSRSHYVIIAVKPWLVSQVISEMEAELEGKVVISVAANVRHKRIDYYAMPNIAAEYSQSMTFISPADEQGTVEDAVLELFSVVGQVMPVSESQLTAGMMMSGCGIAYVMRMIRAMMCGGVEMGFSPSQAQEIARQTMQGAVTLLQESGMHPDVAIDKVTTPGGVTIKGLNELDHSGFNSAIIRCLKAGLK
ncbi:MAG: pyrroline-5-carboxylate reductase [Bacteroidaceae bacterium]|nr:pyrroline-5-carboxylate reductase [Bacteroidaceae bacterium]